MNRLFRFFSGLKHIKKEEIDALKTLREQAEQGDPQAQFDWGQKHFDGLGMAQNYPEAAKWFRKAAEQHHAKAQSALGMMLYLGRGLEPDPVEAYKWLQLSAEQNNASALHAREKAANHLSRDQIDEAVRQADRFLNKSQAAAQDKHPPSEQGSSA
jgi:TPR repeat protein